MNKTLLISVIICTHNRANLLEHVLESLNNQTLSKDKFEIVIIDDGSSDNTKNVVASSSNILPIKYFYQKNAGLASAKNHGIHEAQGKILLFLDDDDVAIPTLLNEHIKTHREYPEDNYAVLHHTTWSSNLSITPLMHFVTEIGCFLFSYPQIKHGDILDNRYFWGGRSSCKRSFLIEHGIFNPVFHFGCEDIELGYRLSEYGLRVVYNSRAVSMMIRSITFDDFCKRLIKQGRSQYVLSTLHNDSNVHQWAEVIGAEEKWNKIRYIYNAKIRAARELDKISNMKLKYKLDIDDLTKKLLHKAYWWAFKACKIKGILEAKEDAKQKIIIEQYEKSPKSTSGVLFDKATNFTIPDVRQKNAQPQIMTAKITSYEGYIKHASQMQSEYDKREQYERSFITDSQTFKVNGHCYVCNQKVEFFVDYSYSYKKNGILTPDWRERLLCPKCGLCNRMRASIHLFERLLHPGRESIIYVSEQITPIYKWFVNNYSNVIGSEYLGKAIPFGKTNKAEIRNESLTELSFSDNKFHFILSFDVFEHIPDFQKAFQECLRVLKPKGTLFFAVPFSVDSEKNLVRAVMKENNKIEHLLPPEHHGDPLHSLAFYRFGWEMLGQLKGIGFDNVSACLYWSKELGYLGGEQIVFVAEKNSAQHLSSLSKLKPCLEK